MRKYLFLLAGLTAAMSLNAAAQTSVPRVQLDGQYLEFTDAVPQVVEQRTFLPFRTVFEAMGAQVSNEGNIITAQRGEKTLTMTIGSPEAVVTESGTQTPIHMDVAPYVDPESWRTYVPVRFAAQAFDCVVEWDQEAYAAVLVDTEKLVADAVKDKSYTWIEKVKQLHAGDETGIWDTDARMDLGISLPSGESLHMTGDMELITRDTSELEGTITLDLDMAEAGTEDTPEPDPMPNIEMAVELRRGGGDDRLYMTAEGALLNQMGFVPGTWYAMTLDGLEPLSGKGESPLKRLLQLLTDSGSLTVDAEQGYTKLKAAVETVARACSDEAFVREGDVCRWTGTQGQMGEYHVNGHCTLELEEDTVTGMDLALDISTADPEGTLVPALTADYRLASDGGFHFDMMLDESEVQVELTLEGQHVPGTTPPQTTLPEGAVIMDITPAA